MGFELRWERYQDILIATVLGRIDAANAADFQGALSDGIDDGEQSLLLDFESVSFLSSAGLRISLRLAQVFSGPNRRFGICSLSGLVRDVVYSSGFNEIIPIHESREAAVDAFQETMAGR